MAHQTYQKSFDNHHIRRRVTITQRRVYWATLYNNNKTVEAEVAY